MGAPLALPPLRTPHPEPARSPRRHPASRGGGRGNGHGRRRHRAERRPGGAQPSPISPAPAQTIVALDTRYGDIHADIYRSHSFEPQPRSAFPGRRPLPPTDSQRSASALRAADRHRHDRSSRTASEPSARRRRSSVVFTAPRAWGPGPFPLREGAGGTAELGGISFDAGRRAISTTR